MLQSNDSNDNDNIGDEPEIEDTSPSIEACPDWVDETENYVMAQAVPDTQEVKKYSFVKQKQQQQQQQNEYGKKTVDELLNEDLINVILKSPLTCENLANIIISKSMVDNNMYILNDMSKMLFQAHQDKMFRKKQHFNNSQNNSKGYNSQNRNFNQPQNNNNNNNGYKQNNYNNKKFTNKSSRPVDPNRVNNSFKPHFNKQKQQNNVEQNTDNNYGNNNNYNNGQNIM